jgi:RNA polymerase sigma-70 factor, ECF subfamily
MARICEGDQDALACLFRRYAPSVRGVAYKVLRDPSEADDLLQEVFLLIYRLSKQYDGSRGSVRFWILLMTHRRAISRRRYLTSRHFYNCVNWEQEADRSSYALAASPRCADVLEEIVEKTDTLRSWCAELSEKQRETLQLFFFEGYSFEEIASKLGQTIGNARNHYYRGLERLRRKMFAGKTVEVRRT